MFIVDDKVANNGGDPVTVVSLRALLAPWTTADAGLLHPARGPDRRARRQPRGVEVQERRREAGTASSRAPAAGSASPTNTGLAVAGPRAGPGHQGRFLGTQDRGPTATRPTIAAMRSPSRPGADRRDQGPAVRRRQGGRPARPLSRDATAYRCSTVRSTWAGSTSSPSRCSTRCDFIYRLRRQFRHRDPDPHPPGQAPTSSRSPTSPTRR